MASPSRDSLQDGTIFVAIDFSNSMTQDCFLAVISSDCDQNDIEPGVRLALDGTALLWVKMTYTKQ